MGWAQFRGAGLKVGRMVGKFSIYATVASMSLNENLAGEMLIELELKTLETSEEY